MLQNLNFQIQLHRNLKLQPMNLEAFNSVHDRKWKTREEAREENLHSRHVLNDRVFTVSLPS